MTTSTTPTPGQGAIIALSIICGLLIVSILFSILLFLVRERYQDDMNRSILVHPSRGSLGRSKRRLAPTEWTGGKNDDPEELKDFASEATVGSDKSFERSREGAYPTARIPYIHTRRSDVPESHAHFHADEGDIEVTGIPHAYFPGQLPRYQNHGQDVSPISRGDRVSQ